MGNQRNVTMAAYGKSVGDMYPPGHGCSACRCEWRRCRRLRSACRLHSRRRRRPQCRTGRGAECCPCPTPPSRGASGRRPTPGRRGPRSCTRSAGLRTCPPPRSPCRSVCTDGSVGLKRGCHVLGFIFHVMFL